MNADSIDNSLPKIARAVQEILREHSGVKGIIHCHSYKIVSYLRKHIKDKRLLFHGSDDRDEVLKKHVAAKTPTVLVSPSMSEGVDLKGDLARFQVILKVPYPSLGDKLVRKRMHKWDWWYPMQTVKTVVQAVGRAVRSADDHAVTYILDADWSRFESKHGELLPKGFKDCIRRD
jgi:Rad3-related DNA helicase